MDALLVTKTLHVACAYCTGIGFVLRAILAINNSALLRQRWVRVAPHLIDTVLLASGIILVVTWFGFSATQPWLGAKIAALLAYIGFGLLLLRFGTSSRRQWVGLIGGVVTYLYIVGVAHTKSLTSLLAIVS